MAVDEMTLERALSDIVLPSIGQVLKPGELRNVALGWGETEVLSPTGGPVGKVACLRLSLDVMGEIFIDVVYDAASAPNLEVDDLRSRLVSNLVDFVAESQFGWGENRTPTATY